MNDVVMGVNHQPIYSISDIVKSFRENRDESVRYICTTELEAEDIPVDIYYRTSGKPHPTLGYRYFGLYRDLVTKKDILCDADNVEEMYFGMVKDKHGGWHYSKTTHHLNRCDPDDKDTNWIEGGRKHIRYGGKDGTYVELGVFKLKDGKFYECQVDGEKVMDENGQDRTAGILSGDTDAVTK
jgi:hypothetical protein